MVKQTDFSQFPSKFGPCIEQLDALSKPYDRVIDVSVWVDNTKDGASAKLDDDLNRRFKEIDNYINASPEDKELAKGIAIQAYFKQNRDWILEYKEFIKRKKINDLLD